MKPPYTLTSGILELITSISEMIGEVRATHLSIPTTELRKRNRIKTIQSSLEIEGNTLSEEQITALLDGKSVLAPKKDIIEIQNAIEVYQSIQEFSPFELKDLEKAHAMLMKGLISIPGKLRTTNVGIVKGSEVAHIAPGGTMVKGLMKDLFDYLKQDEDLILIKSCVFHYELEFIHPFLDGNGRIGRLWQRLILIQQYPLFEYLPIERLIKQNQSQYYAKLSESDKKGSSTAFIEFMLRIILATLEDLLNSKNQTLYVEDRVALYSTRVGYEKFSRKDYLQNFKNISAPTASRDLKWAVDSGKVERFGQKRLTQYRFK